MAILVVDPDENSSALTKTLSQSGFAVIRATGVRDASGVGVEASPELIVYSLSGDEREGLTEAGTLLERFPSSPLVLVARDQVSKNTAIAALRLGIADVIELGVERERLTERLHVVLERSADSSAPIRADGQRMAELRLQELNRDQRAGRYIQMGMLPPSPMAIDRYRLRHRLYPSLMLSGDFVDYFRITDHHFVFYIADVSGHGASSAFITVLLKNFSRRLRREYRPRMLKSPGEILSWLNRELMDNAIDKHVTMFVGVVDTSTDTLAYASAGQFPHAILADGQGARFLEASGKPVGIFRDALYASSEVSLEGHCSLFVLSDGVLEVMSGKLAAKERGLLEKAAQCHASGAEIWQVLELDGRKAAPDDISCLTVTKEV